MVVCRLGDLRTIVVKSSSGECFTNRDYVRMSDVRPMFDGSKRRLVRESKIYARKGFTRMKTGEVQIRHTFDSPEHISKTVCGGCGLVHG